VIPIAVMTASYVARADQRKFMSLGALDFGLLVDGLGSLPNSLRHSLAPARGGPAADLPKRLETMRSAAER
jgi:hypothetical protein